ncbi:MAG TPA: ferrochelatase [Bryobacteraceae bacterium]|nr:ferrochelatase [Bryobacteraceae bacterium]
MSDAILLVSFGGPEGPEDVIPFLENVLRGKNVPRERMREVADHYQRFGGRSPLNDHNRAILAALRQLLAAEGPALPVYWGNRNWHPLLTEAFAQMQADGIRRVFAFVTSAFSSYSGCRQYLEDIARAQAETGTESIEVLKLRPFYRHPGFLEPVVDALRAALAGIPEERRQAAVLLYTAHSIPLSMAASSPYVAQLEEACRLVSAAVGRSDHRLVYQSRSGPPQQPWLEPDILETLRGLARDGSVRDVVVVPIGFVSEHIEVLYDLDTAARAVAEDLGLRMVRTPTPDSDPRFVAMIRELVLERRNQTALPEAIGETPDAAGLCPADCCPAPARPPSRS